jgi:hypothetical protein
MRRVKTSHPRFRWACRRNGSTAYLLRHLVAVDGGRSEPIFG